MSTPNIPLPWPPAVTVHSLAQASAALAAAGPRGALLLSAPHAAGYAGPAWFLRLVAAAAAMHPDVPAPAALDCGDSPGHALASLRAGARLIILDPTCPAFAAVAGAAEEAGTQLLDSRPPALDLGALDLRRASLREALTEWLASPGDMPPKLG